MVSPSPYFALKLFCFLVIRLLVCLREFSPYLEVDFFRCFGMFYFVFIVLPCLVIFLVFLLSLVPSGLFPRSVSSVLLESIFPFCANMFRCFSLVLSFLFVIVDFLFAFPVEFPNRVLTFCLWF